MLALPCGRVLPEGGGTLKGQITGEALVQIGTLPTKVLILDAYLCTLTPVNSRRFAFLPTVRFSYDFGHSPHNIFCSPFHQLSIGTTCSGHPNRSTWPSH